MKAALLVRTASGPIQQHSFFPGSPTRVSLSRHNSITNNGSSSNSPRISMQFEVVTRPRESSPTIAMKNLIIRSLSDLPAGLSRLGSVDGSLSRIPEEVWPRSGIPVEELGFSGAGGIGKGRKSGGGGGGDGTFAGGNADRSKIGAYYQEMLKSNPTDSLLLRNYGRFLHEVEGDTVKAEEYYGRAILANPGDGEVLSLYGKLIWETQRDEDRAKSYMDRAVHASPHDCMVMGSYAHLMWEAEDDEEKENEVSAARPWLKHFN